MNAVKDFVANVTMDDFKEWQERATSITRPRVEGIGNSWTGDEDWDKKINGTLEENGKRTLPKVVDGVIASSDHLVKSEEFHGTTGYLSTAAFWPMTWSPQVWQRLAREETCRCSFYVA